ncbi:MAG: ADP-ribosylglycohydrolase family protein [Verrucomicrobiaceae bacterium]|nr:MAG: ADP-ribosylglycohydrolase family protein [Verrucomicrobiaceae bacterium]
MKPEKDMIAGCLLGGASGDSLGLPAEGMSRRRIVKRWHGVWRQRLLFGRGMLSDDTEHAAMTAAALMRHPADSAAFQLDLARRLRWWFAACPAAVGMATAKACLRLWLGISPSKAGVRSAGNGPAMRSAIIGAALRHHAELRRRYAVASCRLTHTDQRAEEAALLVSEAAALACQGISGDEAVSVLREMAISPEMRTRFVQLEKSLLEKDSVPDYAARIGCGDGVSGFAPNTVAVVLFAWLRHRGDFPAGMTGVLDCGGDTDSTAAVYGGIAGAECGPQGIPTDWLAGIRDWPVNVDYLHTLAAGFQSGQGTVPRLPWPGMLVRNVFFLGVVLTHGLRRLLPPW